MRTLIHFRNAFALMQKCWVEFLTVIFHRWSLKARVCILVYSAPSMVTIRLTCNSGKVIFGDQWIYSSKKRNSSLDHNSSVRVSCWNCFLSYNPESAWNFINGIPQIAEKNCMENYQVSPCVRTKCLSLNEIGERRKNENETTRRELHGAWRRLSTKSYCRKVLSKPMALDIYRYRKIYQRNIKHWYHLLKSSKNRSHNLATPRMATTITWNGNIQSLGFV